MQGAVTPPGKSLFSVLHHRDFRLFWTGNLLSSTGVWVQNLPQGWLLMKLSGSPWTLGLAGFASLAPTPVLSLVGGALADRLDRRKLLIGCQVAMMLVALAMGLLTSLHHMNSGGVLLLILLTGVGTALNSPAYQCSQWPPSTTCCRCWRNRPCAAG